MEEAKKKEELKQEPPQQETRKEDNKKPTDKMTTVLLKMFLTFCSAKPTEQQKIPDRNTRDDQHHGIEKWKKGRLT